MMLEKYKSWFRASPTKGILYTLSIVILAVFVFSTILVAPKYQTETTNSSYSADPQPSKTASPSPSPVGPNTCIDYDGEAFSADFDILNAQLTRNDDGSLLLSLGATFVDTSRGARSSGKPIPITTAQGGWIELTLQSNLEQEAFIFVIANGRTSIPDWTSQEFNVEVFETEMGADVLFSGSGITRRTSGPFEWAVSTKDQSNAWDVCPDQESSTYLKRLLPYRP
jgi:hypothetical protein